MTPTYDRVSCDLKWFVGETYDDNTTIMTEEVEVAIHIVSSRDCVDNEVNLTTHLLHRVGVRGEDGVVCPETLGIGYLRGGCGEDRYLRTHCLGDTHG